MANIDAGRTAPETRGQRAARSAVAGEGMPGSGAEGDRYGRSTVGAAPPPPRRAERLSLSGRRGDDDLDAAHSVRHTGELVGWERWATLVGGGLLVRWGLKHGGLTGLIGAALGGTMAWSGANGRLPSAAAGLTQTEGEARIARERGWSAAAATATSITIAKPAEALYRFWRDLPNLARIMAHVESIEAIDETRSRWTVSAPAGQTVSWEARLTDDQPNRRIAWESVPGASVRNYGWVEFRPAPADRGTEVKALIVYEPPAGQLGRWIARMFLEEPGVQLREDLRRFKQIMETGSAATAETARPR